MKLSLNNFLYGIKQIVMGGGRDSGGNPANDSGYIRQVTVPLGALDLNTALTVDATGGAAEPVVVGGAYLADDETNARVVLVEEGIDTIGRLTFAIPSDYDEVTDHLKVRVLASQLTVSTDTDVELDSNTYVKRAGVALSADQSPAAPGTVLSTTEQWIEFDLSGLGLERDDVVTFRLITNGANDTNAEEVLIHGVKWEYRSTLVSYDETDDDGNALR